MKCPRCGWIVTDAVPKCGGCDFSVADLDQRIGEAPQRQGLLTDDAALFSADERAHLEAHLGALSRELEGELVVVTVHNARGVKPAQLAFWLHNRWNVGGPSHAGLLVLVAKDERRVECEVGYAWEGAITDDESGDVLDREVVPRLREGRFAEGLKAGIDALAVVLRQIKEGAVHAPVEVTA